jgi:hypothetical protein
MNCLAGVALPLGLRGADSPRLHLVYTRVGWTLEHVCQQVEVVSDPSCEIPFTAVGCRPGVHHVTEILHTVGEVSRFRGDLRSGCLFGRKLTAANVIRGLLFGGWRYALQLAVAR